MRSIALARLLDMQGRHDEAGATLAAIDACAFPHGAVWIASSHAIHQFMAGNAAAARETIVQASDLREELRCLACEAIISGVGSEILAGAGDAAGALMLANRAECAGAGAFILGRLMAARARLTVALRAHDWEGAIAQGGAARRLADACGRPFERAQLLLLLGMAYAGRHTGDDDATAHALLTDALATFEQVGASPFLADAQAALDRLNWQPASPVR